MNSRIHELSGNANDQKKKKKTTTLPTFVQLILLFYPYDAKNPAKMRLLFTQISLTI